MKAFIFAAIYCMLLAEGANAADHNNAFDRLFRAHSEELNTHLINLHINHHEPTPPQAEGPFFPVIFPVEQDADLTVIGNNPIANGLIIYINGTIRDIYGNVIPNALVQIWQANMRGSYDHPNDTNPAPRDPNFQYYGKARTNSEGQYSFKTIVPGAYPAGDTWVRPPHIHYKVEAAGFKPLTTQLYFDGSSFVGPVCYMNEEAVDGNAINSLNSMDYLLRRLSAVERRRLTVPFNEIDGNKVGQFDIYLVK